MNQTDKKTPVTVLQEILIKKQILPTYNLIGGNGAGTHEPIFQFEVSAPPLGLSAIGSGKSKKEAKHEAARLFLEKFFNGNNDEKEDILELNKVNSPYAEVLKDNAVGMLLEFCSEKKLRLPDFDLIRDEGLPHDKLFSYKCSVSSFTTEAQARTKKQAKQLAAQEMLNKLKDCLQDVVLPPQSPPTSKDDMEKANDIVIKKLIDIGYKKGNPSEQFGINISEYHQIFSHESYPKSELLESIKNQNKESPWTEGCPIKMCKDILEELDFQYKVETLPTSDKEVAVCLTVEGNPTWAFYGNGTDKEQAVRNVFIEGLSFLIDMVK